MDRKSGLPFQTIWIENQATRNVGPDLRSILFVTQHHFWLKTGCIAWDGLNSDDIEICQFYKMSKKFWGAL